MLLLEFDNSVPEIIAAVLAEGFINCTKLLEEDSIILVVDGKYKAPLVAPLLTCNLLCGDVPPIAALPFFAIKILPLFPPVLSEIELSA